jgi:hypothetical protein
MPTIYELLGQMGGQQKLGFDLSKLNIKKIFGEDKRAFKKYQIALEEARADREREISNQRDRGAAFRFGGKVLDFITGSPIGTIGSNLFQGVTKNRRFTLSNPFGERVADPYRDLDVERPETTFLRTDMEGLDSKAKSISDFISRAESSFDQAMIPNLITDLITSGQTKAAGFTPEYVKDIFKNVKEGENFFDAFKVAEQARKSGLINEAKTSLSKNVGASSVDSKTFSKRFLKEMNPYEKITSLLEETAGTGYSKFKRGQGLIDKDLDPRMLLNPKTLFKSNFQIDDLDESDISSSNPIHSFVNFLGGK